MAKLQKEFLEFHENIKLKRFDENSTLRDKRDIVLNKLRERLKAIFKDKEQKPPTFTFFNQGSYQMGTGILPVKGDFDIDIGLKFNLNKNYLNPYSDLKSWVHEALYNHTKKVDIRKPCITVFYQKDEEDLYHLDLALYVKDDNDNLYLARGKSSKNEEWELAEPEKLIQKIEDKYSDADDKAQFRRVIKYLKRWKNIKFPLKGNSEPLGIAITIAAYNHFNSSSNYFTSEYNDLQATYNFVVALLDQFETYYDFDEEKWMYKISQTIPVEPYSDVFEKMTPNQMGSFRNKLEELRDNLKSAIDKVDPAEAAELLSKKVFGDDFPIPEKKETRLKVEQSFPGTSESA